jgi:hypothetical protein
MIAHVMSALSAGVTIANRAGGGRGIGSGSARTVMSVMSVMIG